MKHNPIIYTMGSRFQCWPKPHFPPAVSATCVCSSFAGCCPLPSAVTPKQLQTETNPNTWLPDLGFPLICIIPQGRRSLLQWPGWTVCSFWQKPDNLSLLSGLVLKSWENKTKTCEVFEVSCFLPGEGLFLSPRTQQEMNPPRAEWPMLLTWQLSGYMHNSFTSSPFAYNTLLTTEC